LPAWVSGTKLTLIARCHIKEMSSSRLDGPVVEAIDCRVRRLGFKPAQISTFYSLEFNFLHKILK